jgi:hypothetical protein
MPAAVLTDILIAAWVGVYLRPKKTRTGIQGNRAGFRNALAAVRSIKNWRGLSFERLSLKTAGIPTTSRSRDAVAGPKSE